jgi:hypothetical protein
MVTVENNQMHAGPLTRAIAEFLASELNGRGFAVYSGHGGEGAIMGQIVSSLKEEYKNGDELAHLDIAIVRQATNQVVVLIEIEETTDKPKTLVSDLFGTLMGNSVSLPGKPKSTVGSYTTLIIMVKGTNHEGRNKQIRKIVLKAKASLETRNSEIGDIVVEPFSSYEELKNALVEQINPTLLAINEKPLQAGK